MKVRKVRLPLYLLCMLLTACTTPPPPAMADKPSYLSAGTVPRKIDELLAYNQSLRQLSQADLRKEMGYLDSLPASPHVTIQKAMSQAILRGNSNLARAQSQPASVLDSEDPESQLLRPLAKFLNAHYAELRSLREQIEKLDQQNAERLRRIDQLNHMLEGLKNIERTLPARQNSAVPAAKPSLVK